MQNNKSNNKKASSKQDTQKSDDKTTVSTTPKKEVKLERIAKRMARAGLCSRRVAETWIADGRVVLNGKVLDTPAITVGDKDKIVVDGKVLQGKERTRLWLYHKPSGLVTTDRDPEGRKTVFEALPESLPRVLSVGRLDINTEGLLLLTNDGGLSRMLELPKTGWLRKYRVRAHGFVTQDQLDTLKDGIAVDGVLYGPIEATIDREQGSNVWLNIQFREGKNREVKEVLGSLGLAVNRLIRISYGPFQLGDLPTGTVREIRGRMLRDQLGEKLIEQSGADFDAPIITQAEDIPRTEKEAAANKKAGENKRRPHREKTAAGQVASDTLSRLSTKSGRDGDGRDDRTGGRGGKSGKGSRSGRGGRGGSASRGRSGGNRTGSKRSSGK
ncbi:MAG: pseudouridine synthase [Hyphomicrobiales bacterium]|nr:rRNA pseudouridine synthase [Hyphomicrobiales bacterium]PCH50492.1 MAG: pseudouridine synthase [Hyphomicrobiales bacterium]